MRSIIVVKVLPSLKLRIQIDVIRVRQQLIELSLIRSVGTFDFAIQLWRLGFDIDVPQSVVFDMPVKTSLKLMSPIGSNGADPEGELFDNIVHERIARSWVCSGKTCSARMRVASSMAVY